jgi:RNA polymerase sigma factor (sigma-70 family)
MNPRRRRNAGVNDAIAEPIPTLTVPADRALEGFENLYRRTFSRVYAYAASLLVDRHAAEDVTSQAFERAFRRRRSFDPTRGSAEAWLFAIVRNAALDELRRRKRRASLPHDPESAVAAVHHDAESSFRTAVVRTAVAALEPRERDLVALRFFGGLTHREIAGVLGISESNAGTKLHRAIERLREACDDAS